MPSWRAARAYVVFQPCSFSLMALMTLECIVIVAASSGLSSMDFPQKSRESTGLSLGFKVAQSAPTASTWQPICHVSMCAFSLSNEVARPCLHKLTGLDLVQ